MIDGLEQISREMEVLHAGKKEYPAVIVNSQRGEAGAPHIVSASFPGVRSEVLLHALEEKGIYVSSGSACSSNKKLPGEHSIKRNPYGTAAAGINPAFQLQPFYNG